MAKDKSIGLTDKQEKFCSEYLIDLNGTQAAIRAGYSEKTANEQAARLLANVSIINRLSELRKPLAEKVGITQEMVLNELAKVGFSNLKDYLSDDLDVNNLSDIDTNKAGAIASLKKNVTTFEGGESVTTEIKLHDKIKSLELIGKHLGFFEKDNKQQGNTVVVTPATPEQLKEIAKKLNDEF